MKRNIWPARCEHVRVYWRDDTQLHSRCLACGAEDVCSLFVSGDVHREERT